MKSVVSGVAAVGVLVSATAVINTVSSWLQTPLSDWLRIWLQAYESLFFPIIEETLGKIVQLFGFELADWPKHLIVFYFAFGAAMVRTGQKEGEIRKLSDYWTMIVFWPVIIGFVMTIARVKDRRERENPGEFVTIGGIHSGSERFLGEQAIVKAFVGEVAKIGFIFACAMLLNEAEILT